MILIRFDVHPRPSVRARTHARTHARARAHTHTHTHTHTHRGRQEGGGGGRAEIPAAERSVLRMRRIRWFGIVAHGERSVNGRTQVERERASTNASLARAALCHRQVDPPSSCTRVHCAFFFLIAVLSYSRCNFSLSTFFFFGFTFDVFLPIEFHPGTTSLKSRSRSEDTTSLSIDDFKRYHLFEVTHSEGTIALAKRSRYSPPSPPKPNSEVTSPDIRKRLSFFRIVSAVLIPISGLCCVVCLLSHALISIF